MRSSSPRALALIALAAAAALLPTAARAAVTVNITEMHLCCPACVKAVTKAVEKMEGVSVKPDQKGSSTVLQAKDLESAQKALDAISAAGFCGKLDNKDLKFEEIKAPEGKVTKLAVYQLHNCCGNCTKAIKGALAKVEGYKSDTCKPKETEFVIEGDFKPADAIEALQKAGFYLSLEKPKEKPADKPAEATK